MSEHHHDHHDSDYTCPPIEVNAAPLKRLAWLAALIGGAVFVGFGIANISVESQYDGGVRDFLLAYQTAFVYWLSLPVGSMTLLLLGYLCSASWGLVLRRCFQAAIATWPVMIVFFLPVAASVFLKHDSSFWWAVDAEQFAQEHADGNPVVANEVKHRQELYLNPLFFLGRAAIIFGVFGMIIRALRKWSPKAEDEGNQDYRDKLKMLGGPGVLLWALLFTVAVTDWVMSVETSWFSSMFPVVAGMNCFLTAFAFSTLIFYTLIGQNETALSIVKDKFRIDIGSLTLGFTMVWSYASFCQFMLIWAGNLPEEIVYYRKRLNSGWEFMAYSLMVFHWFLPFIILLFRGIKTNPKTMKLVTILLLTICAVDVIWWIMPCVNRGESTHLHLPMALGAIMMVGGFWTIAFLGNLMKSNILPKKDTAFLANWGHH